MCRTGYCDLIGSLLCYDSSVWHLKNCFGIRWCTLFPKGLLLCAITGQLLGDNWMAIGHFQFTTLFKNQIKYRSEKVTQPLYSSCTLFPLKLQCVIQTHKMFGPRIRKKDRKNQKMCLHNVLSGLCQINPPLEALRILSQSRPDQSPFYIQLAYTCWLNM